MGFNRRHGIRAELFEKTFSLNFVPPIDFYMAMLIVSKYTFFLFAILHTTTVVLSINVLDIVIVVDVLTNHIVNISSTTVTIIIRKPVQGERLKL